MGDDFRLDSLPTPGDRFKLSTKLSSGVWGILYEAEDNKSGKKVAVKVITLSQERKEEVRDEYNVYNMLPPHRNLTAFLGIFRKQGRADIQQAWVVTELCEGGSVGDYVRKLHRQAKRLPEDHVAYILRELIKAIVHLHENNVIHRNIRADNIMLMTDGTVKLGNLGLSTQVDSPEAKLQVCIGSPCWLAPEVATCEYQEHSGYDLRADVWALGVTAIELGDGKPPLQNIHPARAVFQITRNPPPTLFRPANWSQLFNDFITECLEKNPENRPYAQELLEHPFFESLAENETKIQRALSAIVSEMRKVSREEPPFGDVLIRGQHMEQEQQAPQKMLQEDLSAMELLTEDVVVEELRQRANNGQFYTFAGDVLLAINPCKELDIYGLKDHVKYQFKARSDNAPHIFTIADKAYQDVLHNEEPQHILLAGETMSGKTTNMHHAIKHLLYLGKGNACVEDIEKALRVVRAIGSAGTPHNPNSTRHLLQTQVTFTSTGKVSGAILWLYLLEKTRVSMSDKKHANFHIFYYFYDALEADGSLPQWNLEGGRDYRYLRTRGSTTTKGGARENPSENPKHWRVLERDLQDLGLEKGQLHALKNILAAILLLGEVDFDQDDDGFASITNVDVVETVANLLGLDTKKFSWALLNYCVVVKGEPTRRRHSLNEAGEARDVLAQGLYTRLVDWIVGKINEKMSITRALFGDKHVISVMDQFGFECFSKNSLSQLFVNCVNEQLQFHYNQRIFVWEMQEGEEEEIPVPPLSFYDNKAAVDQLLAKPDGLMYILDDSSRGGGLSVIAEKLREKQASHVSATSGSEFTVAHYTGRVAYDATDFPDKNRDFLPPEMIETLRRSSDPIIPILFTGLFSKSGNLTIQAAPELAKKNKGRWGAALTAEHEKSRSRRYNTVSRGQYSQTRQMRTAATTFRGTCLELLRSLAGSNGVHFVRCVRGNLTEQAGVVQTDLLRQQLRALAVLDTARGRQQGYSVRIPFSEFIRRYKFLAFDFDEQVDITKDNCRLLLVRLKMEGWVIGKTKVFLKYYNEEFLNRLYETQVKKIVKVQSMMRAFLAKRNLASKIEGFRKSGGKDEQPPLERGAKGKAKPKTKKQLDKDEAATIIQKQIRGSIIRKQYGPMVKAATGKLDEETILFMRSWYKRWKLKSIFQVLLLYRATRHQDLTYFCQQAHLYNQNILSELQDLNDEVNLKEVDPKARASFLPPPRPSVHKLPFRLGDLPYFDSTYICDPSRGLRGQPARDTDETWDAPLQRNIGEKYKRSAGTTNIREQGYPAIGEDGSSHRGHSKSYATSLPDTPFVREPNKAVKLPSLAEERRRDNNPRPAGNMAKSQVYRGPSKKYSKDSAPPPPKDIIKGAKPPTYGAIRELEDKFRQTNTGNEEEAPFNFQAMLRKTNNKRESLKRADGGFSPTPGYNNNNNSSSYSYNSPNNNVVFRSDNNNRGKTSRGDQRNGNLSQRTGNTGNNNAMELAPGFVIHGEVADL